MTLNGAWLLVPGRQVWVFYKLQIYLAINLYNLLLNLQTPVSAWRVLFARLSVRRPLAFTQKLAPSPGTDSEVLGRISGCAWSTENPKGFHACSSEPLCPNSSSWQTCRKREPKTTLFSWSNRNFRNITGISTTAISGVYGGWSWKSQTSRTIGRLVADHRKATVTQATTAYKNNISTDVWKHACIASCIQTLSRLYIVKCLVGVWSKSF